MKSEERRREEEERVLDEEKRGGDCRRGPDYIPFTPLDAFCCIQSSRCYTHRTKCPPKKQRTGTKLAGTSLVLFFMRKIELKRHGNDDILES